MEMELAGLRLRHKIDVCNTSAGCRSLAPNAEALNAKKEHGVL
jgi:hypothetical protein